VNFSLSARYVPNITNRSIWHQRRPLN